MVTHPLTVVEVLSELGTDFEQRVFKAALLSLEQEANPLRLNHFATTLRELSRIVLARLAPDAQIKACSWYARASGEPEITRKQRITYAVQAGLDEIFVTDTLALDVNTMCQDLLNSIKTLNKYTHIEPAVFGITGDDLEGTVTESLEAFLAFLEMVKECRQSVRDAVSEEAKQVLHDELLSNTISELDQLATHYNVEDTQIEAVKITLMDANNIEFSVNGQVECRLQYGSGSDVSRGDGLVTYDSFPLTCDFEASMAAPLKVVVKSNTLNIDNTSFYT